MNVCGEIKGTLVAEATIHGILQPALTIQGLLTIPSSANVDIYDGSYSFTPTESEQVITIEHKMATQNITIEPIPYNYGLVTWNGSALTVS